MPVACPWGARGVHVVGIFIGCPCGTYSGDLCWVPVWYIWWESLLCACGVPVGCPWIARGVPVVGVPFRYLLALWGLTLVAAKHM